MEYLAWRSVSPASNGIRRRCLRFNEKVHAFIAARYYMRLTEAFGQRGQAGFVHAMQYYAGQRGRRMAQRAIRNGQPLTHETFL